MAPDWEMRDTLSQAAGNSKSLVVTRELRLLKKLWGTAGFIILKKPGKYGW